MPAQTFLQNLTHTTRISRRIRFRPTFRPCERLIKAEKGGAAYSFGVILLGCLSQPCFSHIPSIP
jgi:hypothetical protein